ncbi:class I SAM-dependent methyltransferase [Amycolatopsis cynarae]|uniref:Class I SAM-dependent methyltransferase n=1 Tax=Amycolatopsis cynarae TaxID=2995223 RepID=A0ABY7B8H3_9PSEU|nr:class I SAM-dependent methyltransferase [Amycolatopsis sp. HUAS 11-8]WAL67468.1 class I SAM-dependent methyltransferase [Amycolatopsis sp. HUAS 11-8]
MAIGDTLLARGSEAISPTGHYTGYVWVRNGLAPAALATPEGRLFYHALEPAMTASRLLGGPTFEDLLLARHRVLDALLAGPIERGEIGQVVEIAAGLSARGWRFTRRYGDKLTYVEADLPGMASRKRRLLARLGGQAPRVAVVDALREDGPDSLASLARTLDEDTGTAIVTEGLLNYFDTATVRRMWARFATVLRRFPVGAYFADLVPAPHGWALAPRLGTGLIAVAVRGRVHHPFTDPAAAVAALHEAGFATAEVRPATDYPASGPDTAGARLPHIIDART